LPDYLDAKSITPGTLGSGDLVRYDLINLKPLTTYNAVLRSVPTVVDAFTTDSTGSAAVEFPVPDSFAPHLHVLTIEEPSGLVVYAELVQGATRPECDWMVSGGDDVDGDWLIDGCDGDPSDGPIADVEGDGMRNAIDNCPTVPNSDQADTNGNDIGDVCDPSIAGSTPTGGYRTSPLINVPTVTTSFSSLVPGRLLETRVGPTATTVDGQFEGIGLRAAGSVTELQITGRSGVPSDAAAAVLNVTVADAQGDGFVTVWPCGAALPNASNLNYATGATVPNAVITKIGAGGKICFYTLAATHLIVDVNGYYPA
jgi:hypothetical protein